ncbi:MAG: DedA family protein [Chloroflexota bacterium]
MDFILQLVQIFLHLDKVLADVIRTYGTWTYLLLFAVIFMETGFVITPFLPGDSLIFAAGTFAGWNAQNSGMDVLDIKILFILLAGAAILGDTVNYWIGHYIGPRAFAGNIRFLKKEYLDRTHAFYERHGGKTIIIARFIPIIRTFAPFVAGVGAMTYSHFIAYNVIGGIAWVTIFLLGGFFFGDLEIVQKNFSLVVIAIIIISVLPAVVEIFKERSRARVATPNNESGTE